MLRLKQLTERREETHLLLETPESCILGKNGIRPLRCLRNELWKVRRGTCNAIDIPNDIRVLDLATTTPVHR